MGEIFNYFLTFNAGIYKRKVIQSMKFHLILIGLQIKYAGSTKRWFWL